MALPVIREDIPAYLAELKRWLDETRDVPLEEMAAFFGARLDSYEEHMRPWREAYRAMARMLPPGGGTLLDLGCGTGLELDAILALQPRLGGDRRGFEREDAGQAQAETSAGANRLRRLLRRQPGRERL